MTTGNEPCIKRTPAIFIRHNNCDFNDEDITKISDSQMDDMLSNLIEVCKCNIYEISEEQWNSSLCDAELEDDKSQFTDPLSLTTSIVTALKPMTCVPKHTAQHKRSFNFNRDFEIMTGPECKVLIKIEESECDVKPSYPKFTSSIDDSLNIWYGIIMSIDRFLEFYELILDKYELNEISRIIDQLKSYLKVWEQSKQH